MKLWESRVGTSLAPAVEAFLQGDDAELLPYDCAATVESDARRGSIPTVPPTRPVDEQTQTRRDAVTVPCTRGG